MHEPTSDPIDLEWMRKALAEACKGDPSPNPHVGAAIVKNNVLLGVGYHEKAGTDHAEVRAIQAARGAGADLVGATLYVTLEPCNHTGKTPPCTQAIAQAGIARVVVGTADPNPNVPGGGIAFLRSRGITVEVGVAHAECEALIRPWRKHVERGLPYVSLKLALTLDGRIATRTGASRWVTGKAARAKVHALRAKNDGISVGIGTLLADNPRLTVRDAPGRDPTRIIFDSKLRTPTNARLVATARETKTWIITRDDLLERPHAQELAEHGVRILGVDGQADGRLNLTSCLKLLARKGIVRLMLEGGAELAGSFLAEEFVDELHAFIAPSLFGPRGRPGAVDWAGPRTPQEAPRIRNPKWVTCGPDAYVHGEVEYAEDEAPSSIRPGPPT
jgi:diaminohydroxyphosphoribosylaminopyrimidine deaminase / 5-amino-6-(5-phosphoribosylamino)uracil reductase